MKYSTILSTLLVASTALAAPTPEHAHHLHKRSSIESSTATSSATKSASSSASSSTSTSYSSVIEGDLADFEEPSETFEDGKIKCSEFPSGQGVIPIEWIGLDGWTTISDADATSGTSCKDGMYCSYACQAGMSKTQWPSAQPSSGASVGGLYCKNGYLYRSNTDFETLCVWGKDTAVVTSEIDEDVAVCRTDYPGSENMNVPTLVTAGEEKVLTVVDEDSYFEWKGTLKTSAQYYVNNAGISVEDGCIWGTSAGTIGNWAPLVFGAGYTDGVTYLSLIPNPNNEKAANYNVKISAYNSTTVLNGDCVYEDGTYNGDGTDGCTVAVTTGKAQFVLYN